MSPPHSAPWNPDHPSTGPHSHEPPFKSHRSLSPSEGTNKRPWTNAEQEALYVAVERHNLYGRWAKVRDHMHLERSVAEIEQEYMRLYGELPDSEDENQYRQGEQRTKSSHVHVHGHTTPVLTTASTSTLSTQSSLEAFSSRFHHSPYPSASEHSYRSPRRIHSVPHSNLDDAHHNDENDDLRMDAEQSSPVSRLLSGKNSGNRSRSDSTTVDGKPTRTVRVWTPQQSEQLKSLIEDCFPDGYRINWVWVASQMGNTFTRKQCKNKWEIMRRRAGTEEEINLLKKGHEEFGPAWSKIQEKYLPERSQGGISIMWNLLQARESEQQYPSEKHQSEAREGSIQPGSAPKPPARSPRWKTASQPMALGLGPACRKSTERDRPYRPRVLTQPTGDDQEGPQRSPSDRNRDMMDRQQSDYYSHNEPTSRETSLSPLWRREAANIGPSVCSTAQHMEGISSSKRFSVSSTDSFYMSTGQPEHYHPQQHQQQHHQHHQQQHHRPLRGDQAADSGFEPWTERNRPMTWTEPLTRQLEEIIHQYFPSQQKVNWVKVSTLMGRNPVVTKEQCKRRWYLMSQYEHLRPRLRDSSPAIITLSAPNDMAVDMDPSGAELDARRGSHARSLPTSPIPTQLSSEMSPLASHLSKRPSEYVPWTEEEVEKLKQGVEKFGRSWTDIQHHYLKDRSVGSMASKWDYLLLKMRSTMRPGPEPAPSGVPHSHPKMSGADFSEEEMEVDEYAYMDTSRIHHQA
ncbi:hypothetical protein BGZ54_007337 [Gamsiella multidivaricata]|nr:hypothetical protein BGZ54_007337 [Gamsiella multidivaricata]